MNVITCQDLVQFSGPQTSYLLLAHADDSGIVCVTPDAFAQLKMRAQAHAVCEGVLRWNVEGLWLIVKRCDVYTDGGLYGADTR